MNGSFYSEILGRTSPSGEFRVLVRSDGDDEPGRLALLDIDAADVYLRTISGAPCKLQIVGHGERRSAERIFEGITQPPKVVRPGTGTPEALSRATIALGSAAADHPQLTATLADAITAGVDFVVVDQLPAPLEPLELLRKLDLMVGEWPAALRECEVFMRGHGVPWAFSARSWWMPWTGFYTMTERPVELYDLWEAIRRKGLGDPAQELTRSLVFNRHPALAFTRDVLLGLRQQVAVARRVGAEKQDYAFECSYYLNHYYLLLWAGVDQLCWTLNAIYGLGIGDDQFWKLGALKTKFVNRVQAKAPAIAPLLLDSETVEWLQVIAAVRHQAAHRVVSMPAETFIRGGDEPSEAELDAEINASEEWRDLVGTLGPEIAETFRAQHRYKHRLLRYEPLPERLLHINVNGTSGAIAPMRRVEFEFEQFMALASSIARLARSDLERRGERDKLDHGGSVA